MKRLREERGMTLAELARLTRKTKGYLSKLERSRKLPPFTTLSTIAQALGADLDLFLAGQIPATGNDAAAPRKGLPSGVPKGSPAPSFRNLDIHRHHEGVRPFLRGDSYAYLPLVTQYRGKYMSPFLMKLPPGKSRTFTHDSEEFTMLLEGRVDLIYEKRTHHLSAGDSFYLDSRIEHAFFNSGRRDALLLSVSFDYRRF
jgi:transcriptional regulator with XRE-family HTH domain